jgi:hypothetical protein
MGIAARLLAVYLFCWTFLTAADLYTTLLGVERGYQELNSHTDFSSLLSLILPEVIAGSVGGLLLLIGAVSCRQLHQPRPAHFNDFRRAVFPYVADASILLVLPLTLAIGRSVAVLNNVILIAFDIGLTETLRTMLVALGISGYLSSVILNALVAVFMFKPASYIIYKSLKI